MASVALRHQENALLLSTEASYFVHGREYIRYIPMQKCSKHIITLSTNCTHHEAVQLVAPVTQLHSS